MSVAKMRILRWMCGHTRKNKIMNEDIQDERKSVKAVWTCETKTYRAPVRRCDYETETQGQRGRGRPLRKYLDYLDLTEDMTQDRA
ncbi:unnamed protein product [Malus baccata var. baccata]